MVKFKELSVLELVKYQSQLARRMSEQGMVNPSIEEYAVELIELMKDRFDFSGVEGVSSFEEAKNDVACVDEMIKHALAVLEKVTEVYKKKTSLQTPTTSTQEVSKKKNSKA
jgi:energy-converting hydrogenase A subunit M